MINIPETYYKNNEDYITIPVITKFMKLHPDGNFKLNLPREDLMKSIIEYGNVSKDNEEEVLTWIDNVLVEGIKDIYLSFLPLNNDTIQRILYSQEHFNKFINNFIASETNKHICMNKYSSKLVLVNCEIVDTKYGKKVLFLFCKKLFTYDRFKKSARGIDYPIIAEYYLDNEFLLVRAKPRSNLYLFNSNGFVLEDAIATTSDKQIKEAKEKVIDILQLNIYDKKLASEKLKSKIFNLLHKFTNTPEEIKAIMKTSENDISHITDNIIKICNTNDCFNVESQRSDLISDIENIVEKYLSINWKDNNVFIKDRDAFPVKLSATDEEESKVEQTAALSEPLQTKALFFDNKKMLYKSQKCDGVTFQWKRICNEIFADYFSVKIYVNPKGDCVFKFPKYTESEDINNVIFSIVTDEGFSQ